MTQLSFFCVKIQTLLFLGLTFRLIGFWLILGLAGVTNCIHSYDVLTRKWTRHVLYFCNSYRICFYIPIHIFSFRMLGFRGVLETKWLVCYGGDIDFMLLELPIYSDLDLPVSHLHQELHMLLRLLEQWLYFRWSEREIEVYYIKFLPLKWPLVIITTNIYCCFVIRVG